MDLFQDPNGNLTVFKPEARTASEVRLLGWNVPPSELRYIPDHWLSYPEPPASMHYLLGLLYIGFCFAAIIGNGLVIWIFVSAKSLRTPSNVFVVNLAICDFIMMCKTPIFIYNSFKRGFALGHVGCQTFAFVGSLSGIGAGMTNAFIANDRYNVIARPMEGKLTHTKAFLMVVLIWLYTIPWAVLPLVEFWGRFVPATIIHMFLTLFNTYMISNHGFDLITSLSHKNGSIMLSFLIIYGSDSNNIQTILFKEPLKTSNVRFLGWNVPPEELRYIPDYWLIYPEPPEYMHYFLAIVYIGFTFFALVGNGLVIWIFAGAKSLRTPSNIFVLNLAICDFMMMCKTPIFIYNSFKRGFALGHVWCQVFAFIGSLSGIGAGMTNAFIGYDRFNVIARPMAGKLTFTKALLIVFLIWVYTVPWAIFPLLEIWGRFVPEGYLTACSFDYMTDNFDTRLFVGVIFTCSYVVPMSMIIYYYSQIVSHVFSHEKALREQAKKMNVESLRSNVDKNKDSAEIRIAKAAITICFLFVAAWTPYGVMSLIGAFGDRNLLTPGVTMIPACACKLVACIDPYVYAISHPRYRMELQKKLPWLSINEKPPAETVSSSGTTVENATTAT